MTDQKEKAARFRALHDNGREKGAALILYNIWDAASALAVQKAGAAAIATSSWSVAAAQGFEDGEALPLDLAVGMVRRIASAAALPVTADVEGAYAEEPEAAAANVARFVEAGAVGVNVEDRRIRRDGLYETQEQASRIAAIRRARDAQDIPDFINARTDLFFGARGETPHHLLIDEACARAHAYAEAGADGFFVPGLAQAELIEALCSRLAMPVNVMASAATPPLPDLQRLGVRRISFGPAPFIQAMEALRQAAEPILSVTRRPAA
jgi:2-methylisocitrate lyase-like PEP mutase family enzyme